MRLRVLVLVTAAWAVACLASYMAGLSTGRAEIDECPTAIVSGSLVAVCPLFELPPPPPVDLLRPSPRPPV